MFERYTERARRVLFFARYEASQLGSISIETEHLLLGLIREGKGLTSRIFARSHLSLENIRKEIEGRTVFREKVSTSVEIPFSAETKRVLQFAAEEADRLLHNYIGTEHLLLGILREERSVAATILMEKGMRLHQVREDIVQLLNEKTSLKILSRWDKSVGGNGTIRILRLSRGEVWARAGSGERQLEVETPASVASARDAEIDLKVADDGQSTLTVMQGTADFATPFGQCSVRVGTASIGARGAGCTAPQPANAAAAAGWKQAVSQ